LLPDHQKDIQGNQKKKNKKKKGKKALESFLDFFTEQSR
jgi:hypothetical protein